ncbi:LOW QUALITY PROTEIN: trithorax group protein osa [Drosophila eugracilis]|uniref:LOW QUALITY PROTEIN: trithorax group protein osa n=1 Tax=Drosophila eugracilis TaxID=29029 RepID=UPI0007E5DB33|nr:LOW QUALITY PROTEIN: trithorax group protein osa [Drosophila eugracilis]
MSHGEDVLDNWEEIDEAGLSMTLQTKLQTSDPPAQKMKLLQRPQTIQEPSQILSSGGSGGSGNPPPRQITIARKPQPPPAEVDPSAQQQPVMMVLHKSSNEYDSASYATPTTNQTVKILRRPAQAEERRDTNGMRPKQPIKTLKQREQEYAEARLRILGAAKNPEDDKPATPSSPAVNSSAPAAPPSVPPTNSTTATPPSASSNNNVINNNGSHPAAGMHRSSSAPKMSQVTPMYNNYNSYFQGPHNQPGLNYYYNPQQQQQQPPPSIPSHYNQRLPPYGGGGSGLGGVGMPAQGPPQSSPNPQQSWSPVVGGSVSAALLRQQSLQSPQQQQQNQQQHGQHPHPFNDLVLRLPKGPCPNGSIGFQMRR